MVGLRIETQDISHVEAMLLDEDGFCRLLPHATIAEIDEMQFKLFCHKHAIYQYPTEELINFLREQIGDRSVIEVAAGKGNIGRHLGIHQTDSWMQTDPEIKAFYAATGQVPITPPSSVEKLTANEAVVKYQPRVVVACWLTHLHEGTLTQGSAFGADEIDIIKRVETYIHVGSVGSHSQKPALALKHEKIFAPWLASRAVDQTGNHILIWNKS